MKITNKIFSVCKWTSYYVENNINLIMMVAIKLQDFSLKSSLYFDEKIIN